MVHFEPDENPSRANFNQKFAEIQNQSDNAIRSLSEENDNKYANALKGKVSAPVVAVDDVSPVTHDVACKVNRVNFIPYPYTFVTELGENGVKEGITFTVNPDHSITFSGQTTADRNTAFTLVEKNSAESKEIVKVLKDNVMFFSGMNSIGNDHILLLTAYKGDNYVTEQNASRVVDWMNRDFDGVRLSAVFYKGHSADFTVNPQLEIGSVATPYTPYVPDLSAVKVSQYGANIYDQSTLLKADGWSFNGNVYKGGMSALHSAFGQSTPGFPLAVTPPKGPLVIELDASYVESAGRGASIFAHYTDGTQDRNYIDAETLTHFRFITNAQKQVSKFSFDYSDGKFIQIKNMSISLYDHGYTPYIENTFTPNSNGIISGMKSLSPSMTILTDNPGVTIDAEYNRDINKAFAKLEAAILSTGGNV